MSNVINKIHSCQGWGCGQGLIGQGQERSFWGVGNILYLGVGMGSTGVRVCQNLQNGTCEMCILLYVNCTLKKESLATVEL